jgi:hypothetical protein
VKWFEGFGDDAKLSGEALKYLRGEIERKEISAS